MSYEQGERSPAALLPLDDENLLSEILLCLPPQPSSLPRASLVSKCWRRLVLEPRFLRRFRIHHQCNAPLLGFFDRDLFFAPTLEPPNRVPQGRFSLQLDHDNDRFGFRPVGCRHGLVLIFLAFRRHVLVWDPVTGDQHRVATPKGFNILGTTVNGAVLRGAGEVHFQVVLVVADNRCTQISRMLACVYSSETGKWGDLISTQLPSKAPTNQPPTIIDSLLPGILVGHSLFWSLYESPAGFLEFDMDTQRLAVLPVPVCTSNCRLLAMRADGGGLGCLSLSNFTIHLWERKIDCDGVASWLAGRTIELDTLLSMNSKKQRGLPRIQGFAEDNNVVFLWTAIGIFMIPLESLQFKKLSGTHIFSRYLPFESIYAAGTSIGGGHDGAELLHST